MARRFSLLPHSSQSWWLSKNIYFWNWLFLCMKSNLLWDFCQTELPKSVCVSSYLNLSQIRSEHRANYSNFSSTSVALRGSFRFILKRHWSFLSEFGQLPRQSSQCKTHSVILHWKLKNDPYTTAADSQNSFTIVGDHWVAYFEVKVQKVSYFWSLLRPCGHRWE